MTDARFLLEDFAPAYLDLARRGELEARGRAALGELAECRSCPRECGAARLENEKGFCRTGRHAFVSSAFPHLGEEACLSGRRGSGTIFFSRCNLRCVFCQNAEISQGTSGDERTADEIAAFAMNLQNWGCHNINFVTPEHVVPQVIEAIVAAVPAGLRLPIVYNTSAYDSPRSLALLDGLVDIYMPDFKLWTPALAERLCDAEDYPERARAAIQEMHRQVGPLRFGPDGLAKRGVLVRHLVMPGLGEETTAIMKWLAEEVSPDTFVNVMAQYRPAHKVGREASDGGDRFEDINRVLYVQELEAAYAAARRAGLHRFDKR
jgi:putative pyruvate formate lyase activating enzyme